MLTRYLVVAALMFFVACDPGLVQVEASAPFREIRAAKDGSEMFAWLAKGAKVEDIVDLGVFSGFHGDMTLAEARHSVGSPDRVVRVGSETVAVYKRDGRTVVVAEWDEDPSDGGDPIRRHAVRAMVEDQEVRDRLPKVLVAAMARRPHLTLVGIAAAQSEEAGIALRVEGGQITQLILGAARRRTSG